MITFASNYLAMILAAVGAIVVGFLWYGPVFGKPWMKAMGYTKDDMEKSKQKGMGQTYAIMTLSVIVRAFILATVMLSLGVATVSGALTAAFVLWLGFSVPLIMHDQLWGGRGWNLFVINASNDLVTLGVMSLILVYWM